MFEIFRLEIRQMLGGRKKWLVLLFLLAPVALTFLSSTFGGLGELRRAKTSPAAPRQHKPGGRKILALEKPLKIAGGLLTITPAGEVFFRGERVHESESLVVNEGWITVRGGEVWIDKSKRGRGGLRIRRTLGPIGAAPGDDLELPWWIAGGSYLFVLYPWVLAILLAMLYGSSLLAGELEGKTLTYLFTRPLARWKIIAGKYLAVLAALAPPLCASLLVSWMILHAVGGATMLAALLVATLAGLACYCALFMLLGFLVPRRAMILALLYSALFEFVLTMIPALVNLVTINYYLRSLAGRIAGVDTFIAGAPLPAESRRIVRRILGGAEAPVALAVLAGVILAGLMLSALLASRREYLFAEEA